MVSELLDFEKAFYSEGYNVIAGTDEAGRGPLAGPVYAAAVILNFDNLPEGIDDSKKLSEKKREFLFDKIVESALSCSVSFATVEEIDRLNILQASLLAMKRAIEDLKIKPDIVLIDGRDKIKELDVFQKSIIDGDALSVSIAAASILAKVARDRYLLLLDKEYPMYNLKRHKGYPTCEHRELLIKYGPSKIHRKTFLKKIFK